MIKIQDLTNAELTLLFLHEIKQVEGGFTWENTRELIKELADKFSHDHPFAY